MAHCLTDIQHIFFDLDNTLWDFNHNSREAIGELFEHDDLNGQIDVDRETFIDRYIDHNERYWSLYRENRISKSRLRIARFEAVLTEFGVEDKPLARRLCDIYMAECPKKSKLIDGAKEVLDALHGSYQLHILSNGFAETQFTKLKASGIDSYFEQVITSERASSRKPQDRIYAFAEQLTGAQPEHSLMIGDYVDIDVIGAVDRGWHAIHYNPAGEEHDYPSITHLSELVSLLGKGG